jgi:kynurenine formamidase
LKVVPKEDSWDRLSLRRFNQPPRSVVMVRSDWSKKWTDDPEKAKALAADPKFPGVSLTALKFLHLKRHILFPRA